MVIVRGYNTVSAVYSQSDEPALPQSSPTVALTPNSVWRLNQNAIDINDNQKFIYGLLTTIDTIGDQYPWSIAKYIDTISDQEFIHRVIGQR